MKWQRFEENINELNLEIFFMQQINYLSQLKTH